MGRKKITDEEIIIALLSSESKKEASLILGCTTRTLYDRMKHEEFIRKYDKAKLDLLKDATEKLQKKVQFAVDALVDVMTDKESPPQTRVNSATAILQYTARYTEFTDIIKRIESLEQIQKKEGFY